jgi:hypothetical protein
VADRVGKPAVMNPTKVALSKEIKSTINCNQSKKLNLIIIKIICKKSKEED